MTQINAVSRAIAVCMSAMGMKSVVALALLGICFAAPLHAQPTGSTLEPCSAGSITEAGYPGIYCFDLVPTPYAGSATGTVDLLREPSPFTVNVNRDGIHTYRLQFTLKNLPQPSTFGDYAVYVAWLTTPELRPVAKLGAVQNGTQIVGEVALNKFIVLVSAENSSEVTEREGRLILRARSPSSLMEAHDLAILAPVAVLRGDEQHGHHAGGGWTMPPPHPQIRMAPGMQGLRPHGDPFIPPAVNPDIPVARDQETMYLTDGDTIRLSSDLIRKKIGGKELVLYGFNGQYPGPRLQVSQSAQLYVEFTNNLEWPTAIHWHGIRLENAFDGVPGLTQEPVEPGETFFYELIFPDTGIYWYHPHHREDIQQDLGLYGNILIRPEADDYWNDVDREVLLLIDDILLDDEGHVGYGAEQANFALMGRFGNTFLINGETDYRLEVDRGEVVRFYLTNTSNTRVFNLSFSGMAVKVVASDVGKYEREEWVESVVIAPAERYVVEALFTDGGPVVIENRVQAIDHLSGVFFPEVDTLGTMTVRGGQVSDRSVSFGDLRENGDITADIEKYRSYFDAPVDRELLLTLETRDLDPVVRQLMQLDPIYFNPVEWSGTMPMMNWQSTSHQVRWILRDLETGKENMDIDWEFETRDVIKIRLHNDRDAFHAMQHPIHLHGQRFLILEQDGVTNENLVWKDTILLPVGSSADILVDLSNPGDWMIHCHIAEHLEAGMKMVFEVSGENRVLH